MLRVPIGQAEPGMCLATPILHPERGHLLLAEGFSLDATLIRRIAEMQVPEVWVDFPGAEQIKRFVSPAVLMQQSHLVGVIADMFETVQRDAHAPLEYERYCRTIRGVIDALVSEPLSAAYMLELGGFAGSDLRHGGEVCLLSILLGLRLQGYLIEQRKRLLPKDARDVVSLGLGAMLHDIGKTQINAEVRDAYEQTRDDRDPRYREHVLLGHRMLSGAVAPSAVAVVLQHHQHFDGSGFPASPSYDREPRGLTAGDIHVFARIACVANHFDRLRRCADGRTLPRVRVLREMLCTPLSTRFDPVVLAALPAVVPAYPPGTIVKLSNGLRGIVVDWHVDSPCQPTVRVLDEHGDSIAAWHDANLQVDMRQQPELRIIEHNGADVSGDNFRLLISPENSTKTAA